MSDMIKQNITLINTMNSEFLTLLADLKNSKSDTFIAQFENMIEYLKDHFKMEEDLMNIHDFYDTQEYIQGHNNTLYEMQYFCEKAKVMPQFSKAYINDYAYDKFKRHIVSIDSLLKIFLKIGLSKSI